jgi:putative NADPH-quinone reductase
MRGLLVSSAKPDYGRARARAEAASTQRPRLGQKYWRRIGFEGEPFGMHVLVIYCHPRPESFCAALREAAAEGLAAGGHTVELIDLYAEGFDPALPTDQRAAYFDEARNHANLETQIAALRRAQGLVLVYPTWWFGMPAMLKGWFDRVWVPGVAFRLGGRNVLVPLLTDVRRIAVVTTYGSPRWLLWWVGWPDRRIVMKGFRPLCARGCRVDWLGRAGMDQADPARLNEFLAKVRRQLSQWR